ncbi:MAG: hypothetical protein V1819_03375 [bacterium]
MNKKTLLVSVIVLVVVVGVGSFYGGMVYAKGANKGMAGRNFNGQQFGANIAGMGQRGDMANRAGGVAGGFVSGEVISQDGQSITVKLMARGNATGSQETAGQAGGSKIVFFSTSTQIMKTSSGSISDIAVGSNLTITGKANSDGTLTAQSIQIRPTVPVVGK